MGIRWRLMGVFSFADRCFDGGYLRAQEVRVQLPRPFRRDPVRAFVGTQEWDWEEWVCRRLVFCTIDICYGQSCGSEKASRRFKCTIQIVIMAVV